MIGFIMWCIGGILLILIGVYAEFSKKPVGFWANAQMFQVNDVKKYNHAVAKLFCVFGIVFIILGIPLLKHNSPFILFSVIGTMIEAIVAMVVYTIVIEAKYKKT